MFYTDNAFLKNSVIVSRLDVTLPFESVILEPPVAEWPVSRSELSSSALSELRLTVRKRLVDSAEQFVLRLTEVAQRAGLLQGDRPLLTGDPATTMLVMTGHQPVVFHSGLTFKYQATEAFAAEHHLIAVAVVIDTDEGDAGAISIPTTETLRQNSAKSGDAIPELESKSISLAQRPGLFAASRLKTPPALAAELTEAEIQMRQCGAATAADAFRSVANQYLALTERSPGGFSTLEANLITRWNANIGGRMLEIPLSAICSFPEFIRVTASILERPIEFAACYNQTLDQFRAARQIRNEANPFPNLAIEDQWCELPYWVINHAMGTRQVLQVRRESEGLALECNRERLLILQAGQTAEALTSLLFGGYELVPRGALITATLRLLFSDLFVHGTGGGHYDLCTNELIRNWWHEEPTPFAVASASRYLFAAERTRLMELQQAAAQQRDMQYNPQRFIGSNVFSAALEEQLKSLLSEKETRVRQMSLVRESGQSAKDLGRQIQEITDAIKAAVSEEFEPRLAELRSLNDRNVSAITSRTWPWLLFQDEVCLKE